MSGLPILPHSLGRRGVPALVLLAFIVLFTGAAAQAGAAWSILGPSGGDARAFAEVPGQPNHLYLGTTNGWIYESMDGGASWHHLARPGSGSDMIFDHIVVDSRDHSTIYAAGWRNSGGGLWVSHDGGRSWSESAGMRGQAIHAFVQSQSDPEMLFAGTLEGVFRSTDSGITWKEISPAGSREIHELASLAVDPADPNIIYVGTWHLPWKTTDGGKTWHSIKRGLIVDSDVFSMVIDPERTRTMYLSACSGIYKSEDGGLLFRKIQGIPSSARRTRVLKQDPTNHEIVYAGTTEGLYKTENGGRTFRRMTGPDVIVNDVYVDPRDPKHVLLATDRGGVLTSVNGGESFTPSNDGVSGRKVEALLVDRNDPQRMYAGVVNDKSYGGVFFTSDGGRTWRHIGAGLDGLDVFSLAEAKDGTVLAGTSHGIFVLPAVDGSAGAADPPGDAPASAWEPRNTLANTLLKVATEKINGLRVNVEKRVKDPVTDLDARVVALDASGDVWLAATSLGLYSSKDKGATWQGGPVLGAGDYESVAVHDGLMVAARPDGVVESADGGLTWMPMSIPQMLTRIHHVAFSPDGTLWLAAREGVYFTHNQGKVWLWVDRLPLRDIDDLCYDPALRKVLVSSLDSDQIFAIDPKTMKWDWWQTGFNVALILPAGNRLVAASMDDGVVMGPVVTGAAAR